MNGPVWCINLYTETIIFIHSFTNSALKTGGNIIPGSTICSILVTFFPMLEEGKIILKKIYFPQFEVSCHKHSFSVYLPENLVFSSTQTLLSGIRNGNLRKSTSKRFMAFFYTPKTYFFTQIQPPFHVREKFPKENIPWMILPYCLFLYWKEPIVFTQT